jgi:hypothetical protein
MPVPDDKRQQAEQRVRAAAAALLAGDIPAGGRCDISTLARQAGVSRATLYRTYPHLKEQFEHDMAAAAAGGGHPDPRDAQIARLKAQNAALKTRCASQDQAITALRDQRALALSRLAAQHDEIQRLRAAAAGAVGTGNVRALRAAPASRTAGTERQRRTALTDVKHPDHHATTADTTTSRGD